MGVTRPAVHITADPALLLQPGTDGAVDSFLLSQKLDPAGGYALFVLRPWHEFAQKKQCFVEAAEYVHEKYGLTPVFFALEPNRDLGVTREVRAALHCESVLLPTPRGRDAHHRHDEADAARCVDAAAYADLRVERGRAARRGVV